MKTSLRLRLVASISGVVLAAWITTAVFSFLDARDRIGAMLDDHLVQAAGLLLGSDREQAARPAVHWGDEGHSLVFQGWSTEGRLLFRSADAPAAPLSEIEEGFSEVERAGHRWRVFAATESGLRVMVAEHAGFRGELAASVARHLVHPVAFAIPILAALIVLAVRWALGPLRSLADEVGRRDPSNLEPLGAGGAPAEVTPLVVALDSLFRRVSASVENERRFTADAAHELRTPLAAIQTHAEVALGARDGEERRQALVNVTEAVSRADRLVGQLLVLARLDARTGPAALVPLALDRLAAEQVAESAPEASRKGINLGLLETRGDPTVPCDPDLVAILLRNLVDNAVRYTPRGETIDISVRAEGDRVVLRVADSGPGLAPDERSRILERFRRGRASGEGSGIGLSIVAR
ncbi:MAG TPA: ATP-binding protein, partial [Vulgatibacter sp.]